MSLDTMIENAARQVARQFGVDARSIVALLEQYCARLSDWDRAHVAQSELNSWAHHYARQLRG